MRSQNNKKNINIHRFMRKEKLYNFVYNQTVKSVKTEEEIFISLLVFTYKIVIRIDEKKKQ